MYFSNSVYIRNKLYQKLLFISIFGGVRGINVSNIPSKCVQVERVTLVHHIVEKENNLEKVPINSFFNCIMVY